MMGMRLCRRLAPSVQLKLFPPDRGSQPALRGAGSCLHTTGCSWAIRPG